MTPLQRITLRLDPGLVLERMILSRLSGRKRARGHAWLRSLLVQGFLAEGQWLRREGDRGGERAVRERSGIPPTDFACWLEGSKRSSERAPAPVTRVQATPATQPAGAKPFAYLRKVIG